MSLLPKISILTPSFNQGKFIEENILSVLNQNYENFEHIIVDGGSLDCTIEILKKYDHLRWVSEPDKGQSDALNKALLISTGEIIGWINSDDYYLENTFSEVIESFNNTNVDWIIGDFINKFEQIDKYLYPDNKLKYPVTPKNLLLPGKQTIYQQSTFMKRSLIEKVGGWDNNLNMILDFELFYRMAKIQSPLLVSKYWAVFRRHDSQKTNIRNGILQLKEYSYFFKKEGISFYTKANLIFNKILRLFKLFLRINMIKLLQITGFITSEVEFLGLFSKAKQKMKNRI